MSNIRTIFSFLFSAAFLGTFSFAAPADDESAQCPVSHDSLTATLSAVTLTGGNGGFGNDMWGTIVNRSGQVCAVARTGNLGDQWPGSRVISAQKANTAHAFSLEGAYPNVAAVGRSLATGNLYGLVLPGGSLFGLQFSNPVNPAVAYGDRANGRGSDRDYGTEDDPMVGRFVGGVNVFGGGLALYDGGGNLVGALGVSGDTSCADHIIAWRVRDGLGLDNIPGGVGDGFTNDNLVLNDPPAPNSFDHPSCGFGEDAIISGLAMSNPIGD